MQGDWLLSNWSFWLANHKGAIIKSANHISHWFQGTVCIPIQVFFLKQKRKRPWSTIASNEKSWGKLRNKHESNFVSLQCLSKVELEKTVANAFSCSDNRKRSISSLSVATNWTQRGWEEHTREMTVCPALCVFEAIFVAGCCVEQKKQTLAPKLWSKWSAPRCKTFSLFLLYFVLKCAKMIGNGRTKSMTSKRFQLFMEIDVTIELPANLTNVSYSKISSLPPSYSPHFLFSLSFPHSFSSFHSSFFLNCFSLGFFLSIFFISFLLHVGSMFISTILI